VFQEYEIHQDVTVDRDATKEEDDRLADGLLEQHIGLLVESSNPRGDCGYYIEGWMAEEYVAIDGNADELCKLMVEFEDDDKKTLVVGEEWDLGGGFALVANQIDLEGDKVWFSLKKDGRELDNEVASTGSTDKQDRVYTYTADIGNEEDIPVFSCYVDAVFRGTDSNIVQVMYVFLIDDDVLEIDTSDTYGSMEVMTASSDRIVGSDDCKFR
jgi:S-layer protein (TIGR01567 family)